MIEQFKPQVPNPNTLIIENQVPAKLGDLNKLVDDVNTEIKTLTAGQPALQTAVVEISSAQIRAMLDTPIELLPALPVTQYYKIDSLTLEYTYNTAAYVLDPTEVIAIVGTGFFSLLSNTILLQPSNSVITISSSTYKPEKIGGGVPATPPGIPIILGLQVANPTTGDGKIRAIIQYRVHTFGA